MPPTTCRKHKEAMTRDPNPFPPQHHYAQQSGPSDLQSGYDEPLGVCPSHGPMRHDSYHGYVCPECLGASVDSSDE